VSPLASETNPLVGDHKPPTTKPMLGLMTHRDPPRYTPIPPGAHIAVFTDPAHPDTAFRWVLVSVSANGKTWKFRCDCTVPGCTRTMQTTASYKGVHPQRER
jgi:hypothetical protein